MKMLRVAVVCSGFWKLLGDEFLEVPVTDCGSVMDTGYEGTAEGSRKVSDTTQECREYRTQSRCQLALTRTTH